MDDSLIADVKKIFADREKQRNAKEIAAWCAEVEATPRSWKPALKAGYVADMELQPHWWLSEGVTLINCRHVDGEVELMDGAKGPVFSSHLPFPVFLAAAESFLKGMHLCRYPECRRIASRGYIQVKRREKYLRIMKDFGHHLPNLIKANKRIKAYRTDVECMQFLNRLDALVRRFYYPLHAADKNYGWATARYPKRFYNDQTKHGAADGLRSFPQQEFVARLFKAMERYLDKKWSLRRGLIERRKRQRASSALANSRVQTGITDKGGLPCKQ